MPELKIYIIQNETIVRTFHPKTKTEASRIYGANLYKEQQYTQLVVDGQARTIGEAVEFFRLGNAWCRDAYYGNTRQRYNIYAR